MSRDPRQYQCHERHADGRLCGAVLKTRWNLKRHLKEQHQLDQPTLIATPLAALSPALQTLWQAAIPHPLPALGSLPALSNVPASAVQLPGVAALLEADRGAKTPPRCPEPDAGPLPASPPLPSMAPSPTVHPPQEDDRWEQQRGILRERYQEDMPSYDVKQSKVFQAQQKAACWILQKGKEHFDSWIAGLTTAWGASPSASQSSICISCPQDWVGLQPREIADVLNESNWPLASSGRLMFKYSDHTTTAARAIAWYSKWPRSGIELDNFMECGPFKRMDGSHLCHNLFCITPSHIVYEPTTVNQARNECFQRARFLRNENRAVPDRCDQHDPPCLMQHAALTTYERCLLQVWALRQSLGMPSPSPSPAPAPAPVRPRFHPYSSLEYQLPLTFGQGHGIRFGALDRAAVTRLKRKAHKPSLACNLCPRIRGFESVVALWGHIVRKHEDRSDGDKLIEIRRTAELWRSYEESQTGLSRRSRKNNTLTRLAEVKQQVPAYVLDVATGTGIWAIEFAEKFPQSHVIGTDLSAIQPENPHVPNCVFQRDDAEDTWVFPAPHPPGSNCEFPCEHRIMFDYVHLRLVSTCFDDPRVVMKNAFENMNPGGWIEFQDASLEFNDDSPNWEGSALQKWCKGCIDGAASVGRDILVPQKYKQWLEETGFVDVQERPFIWPNNPWPQDKKLKEVGLWELRNLLDGLRGMGWKFLTQAGYSAEEIETLVKESHEYLRDCRNHPYGTLYVVYGRKPFPNEE
ncbi:hypothetical protein PFICI_06477 [Pestalotiopsis fici W106-1]|uniref:C2H2-type domain-containing protein n=1 Tax=Pestalotiopsis fici (strain W106-1 / CGMCC3.15140) TaxID=1229662 RepID=W3X5Z6_PESFW|nr:uncharacterized protein PFICI_06477 [Pestalotiopsis fici W106-1]ETS81475.1 hypothetical protein PFICI_06477 [Pestalotiopsis fici W106-1]